MDAENALVSSADETSAPITGREQADAGSGYALRPDQQNVFRDLTAYVQDAAVRGDTAIGNPPMGRIIIPSRLGKTVIAGKFIGSSGLASTFVVPTQVLLEQAVGDFRQMLPDVPVGYYYRYGKALVPNGINVITYQSLVSLWKGGKALPRELYESGIIFADEGHTSMTAKRMNVMRYGFGHQAPRIAMTATPDYGTTPDRDLASHYSELVHELPLIEAMELDLLAPVRIWVAEVDVDASKVSIVAGNYDEAELGKIMSEAPFFEAARRFRFCPVNAGDSALICCASCQQARELLAYLTRFLPPGRPLPRLIDSTTQKDERRAIIEEYEAGKIDTIVNVRTMLTGWNSQRCKLLIDLSPSTSHVLAMQKFFRPLTRWGEREAKIFLLIPASLPKIPALPTDFFYYGKAEYEAGTLIGGKREGAGRKRQAESSAEFSGVERVKIKSRIVLSQRFERPTLDPKDRDAIEQVILSNPGFSVKPLGGYQHFRWLYFSHASFKGHGWQLLRYLDVQFNKHAYLLFMSKIFPESASGQYLRLYGRTDGDCEAEKMGDRELEVDEALARYSPRDWWNMEPSERRTLAVTDLSAFCRELPSPEDEARRSEQRRGLYEAMSRLSPKLEQAVCMRFGIPLSERLRKAGFPSWPEADLGLEMPPEEVSRRLCLRRSAAWARIRTALRKLRYPNSAKILKEVRDP